MSEMSSYSAAHRTNPLYSGPDAGAPAGNRTPSWAKSKHSGVRNSTAYSEAASSPPDSPTRHAASYYEPQYDHPATYTVQTPLYEPLQGSGSPYRAPPSYFVQTPALSEMHRAHGDGSPYSSAPPSPPHSVGPNGTPFDARSMRSGRSRASMRTAGAPPPSIKKIDEEAGGPPKPDPIQVATRRKRFYKCLTGWLCAFLLVGLVAAAVTLWFIYQPQEPQYTYQDVAVQNFTVLQGWDINGLPTQMLTMNLTFIWRFHNPNKFFSATFDGGVFRVGYSSVPVVSQAGYKPLGFSVHPKRDRNFTGLSWANNFPLYNVGPVALRDMKERSVGVQVSASLKSHVSMLWKIVAPSYSRNINCYVTFDPVYMLSLNQTCDSWK